jgi:hypothetical protein
VRGALAGKDLERFRAQIAKTNRERDSAPMLVARADSDSGDAVRATVTPIRSRSKPPAPRAVQQAYLVDSVEMPSLSPAVPRAKPAKARPAVKSRAGYKQRSAIKQRKAVKPGTAVKKRAAVKSRKAVKPKATAKQRTLVAERRHSKAKTKRKR